VYTAATRFEPLAWLRGAERFPDGASLFVFDGHLSRPLVPDFFASADAAVSFDGTRILFAGKRHSKDSWQIWEAVVAGGDPAQITSCDDDCVSPLYLPEDRYVYARRAHGVFQLEAAALKGDASLPLTHVPGNALPSDVLQDGRILFQAGYPLADSPTAELYTVYSDGSGVESYRCDHGPSRHAGKQISSGDVVFAEDFRLARFTSALAHEVNIPAPAGEFAGNLAETFAGEWILPWRPDAKSAFSLRAWNPRSNAFTTVVSKNGLELVEPRLLSAKLVPNRHPSGLHDWDGANILCLNAYTSKFTFADGAIASVRVYTPAAGGKKLLGTAHVESDGSFFLHIPADQPLQFELLDGAGNILHRENGWFWLRRGEQRVCVGCHAGPERAPENAVPAVLVKSTDPVDLTRPQSASPSGGH
jgi:hypothetical protein